MPLCQFIASLAHIALKVYVVNICVKYFRCSRCMLQVFYMDVAKKKQIWMLHILQWLYTYVASVYSKCFIYFRRCKCFIWMLHMLQWLYTYIASVWSKCFICFRRQEVLLCCKCFMSRRRRSLCARYGCCKVDLDVVYVAMAIHACCKYLFRMFHLLQTYVASDFIRVLHMS
jgi:hypothetical protein